MPASFGKVITAMGTGNNSLMPSKRTGSSTDRAASGFPTGIPKSRSTPTTCTSSRLLGGRPESRRLGLPDEHRLHSRRPSRPWRVGDLRPWARANREPAHLRRPHRRAEVVGGPKNWSSGFLPATYQGTLFRNEGAPDSRPGSRRIRSARNSSAANWICLRSLNKHFSADKPEDTELEARINSYELAYRMQTQRRKRSTYQGIRSHQETLRSWTRRPREIRRELPARAPSGRARCAFYRTLLRQRQRLGCAQRYRRQSFRNVQISDKPIAGLLADLKARGLLDDVLVVWGGEFGRTPFNEKGDGRDHNPWGFTMWMAGGGIRGGHVIGQTDEIGLRVIDGRTHVTTSTRPFCTLSA